MSAANERLIEIARRKERLIARAESQRVAIVSSFEGLRGAVTVADKGLTLVRFAQGHPLLVGAGVAAMSALRGGSLLSIAGRGLAVWRAWKSISSLSALLFR
jgi:siroheme synthase